MEGKPTSKEPKMTKTVGKNPWKQSIQCWSCGGDHMCRDFPQIGEKVRTVHSVHQVATVEDMAKNIPRI